MRPTRGLEQVQNHPLRLLQTEAAGSQGRTAIYPPTGIKFHREMIPLVRLSTSFAPFAHHIMHKM
jgi:hypothetical protein